MTPWRSKKTNGPRPLCRECRREEAIAGGLCESCGPRLRARKIAAAAQLKQAHEIADRLYKIDREKYAEVFSFVNKMLKQKRSLLLILHAIEALAKKVEAGEPPHGVGCFDYLSGTLRRLEEKSEATKMRVGGLTRLGDIHLSLGQLAGMKGAK